VAKVLEKIIYQDTSKLMMITAKYRLERKKLSSKDKKSLKFKN